MIKVAVLAGGCSPEHDVSVESGHQVVRHLGSRWQPWPVFLDKRGRWWPSAAPAAAERTRLEAFHGELRGGARPMSPAAAVDYLVDQVGVEVVWPALHGPGGEDGSVQGMLEVCGLPFVGAGCAASAVAMDKVRTRECLGYHGIAMPPAYLPTAPLARAVPADEAAAIAAAVGFPCFLKVDCSGSTLGVQRANEPADLVDFLRDNRRRGRRFLAESTVVGHEVTVGVLGNAGSELEALPPVGIYPVDAAYFTYQAKYRAELCEEICPPRGLGPLEVRQLEELAVRCHQALQCDGMSRTDMIIGPDGPMVLEVNTLPGMTDVSLLPRAAKAAGYSFEALLDRLLDLALARQAPAAPTTIHQSSELSVGDESPA